MKRLTWKRPAWTRPAWTRPAWTRQRLVAVSAAVGTIVLVGAGASWAAASTPSDDYRTAAVETGSVTESLELSGTLASASRRDVSFAVGGTVDSVSVVIGDEVEAGDTLAELNPGDLDDAVDAAEQALAQAEQQLADDLDSQSSASTSTSSSSEASSTGGAGTTSGSTGGTAQDPAVTQAIAGVTTAQQLLLSLLDAQAESLAASQTALTDATAVCAPFLEAELESPADEAPAEGGDDTAGDDTAGDDTAGDDTAGDDTAGDETDAGESSGSTLADVQALLVTCQAAMSGTADAQSVTAAAQDAVSAAMTSLDEAIAALQLALAGDSGSTPDVETPTVTESDAGPTAATPTVAAASAADLVADRAAIAVAELDVTIAEQQRELATLTAPISGTVALVAIDEGATVAASSADAIIAIIGDDGFVVETTVSLDQVQRAAVGQSADVVITSSGASMEGVVSWRGLVNVSESSAPAYDITISIDEPAEGARDGSAVRVDVHTAAAEEVLIVPLSALDRTAEGDSVDVLVDGAPVTTPVTVGALGDEVVEIVQGLELGDLVVLADLGAAIDSGDDESSTSLSDLGGTQQSGVPTGGFTPPDGFTPPEGFTPPTG